MARKEQINELLRKELALIVNQAISIRDCLITISYVDCALDLSYAKIGISVLPDNLSESALKSLRKKSRIFSNILKKKTRLRKIPKLNWVIDETEKEVARIDKLLKEIKREE